MGTYGVMLFVSLVWGIIARFGHHLNEQDERVGMAVIEAIDALLVVGLFAVVGRLRTPVPPLRVRVLAWLTAPVAFAAVLLICIAYNQFLHEFLRPRWLHDVVRAPEWSAVTLLLMAVQPAVVEELFFRYFALNALRDATGTHAAVWVSAVMFALAHVYNPLGLPWLLAAGVIWGYWRVAGGGVILTMVLHFSHNALMIWLQGLL
jgi:membrane protease YdiL (CAAX protease family)